jgi:hypothetical protein
MPNSKMASDDNSNAEHLGNLALADSSDKILKSFTLFPQIPAEIRIQIWESSFVPLRIILMRHSTRPPLRLRSSCALLLVNNESHRVFVQHYALCFHSLGLKGIYINYSLDTLVFAGGLHSLKKMLLQYPRIMRRIQWLDIAPNHHSWSFSWGDMDPEPMSSLRLVTISLNPDRIDAWSGSWPNIVRDIPPTIQHLDYVIRVGSEPNSPKLGVLFARRSSRRSTTRNVTLLCDKLEPSFNLKDPSASTTERFEIGLLESWDYEKQSLRDNALDHDWTAYEVEKQN